MAQTSRTPRYGITVHGCIDPDAADNMVSGVMAAAIEKTREDMKKADRVITALAQSSGACIVTTEEMSRAVMYGTIAAMIETAFAAELFVYASLCKEGIAQKREFPDLDRHVRQNLSVLSQLAIAGLKQASDNVSKAVPEFEGAPSNYKVIVASADDPRLTDFYEGEVEPIKF